MIFFNCCVRCGGDIHILKDHYGAYATCVQCGFTRDLPLPEAQAAAPAGQGLKPGAR